MLSYNRSSFNFEKTKIFVSCSPTPPFSSTAFEKLAERFLPLGSSPFAFPSRQKHKKRNER
jgi:hypothetical protein